MALTKVSRGLLSTSIVDNGNATAITIDSSEQVGIGTSSPQAALHVSDSGATQILVGTSDNSLTTNQVIGEFGIYKADPSGSGSAQVTASMKAISVNSIGSGSALVFSTDGGSGANERARIDASGNLLVGKTATGTTTAGSQLNADGLLTATRDGNYASILTRLNSDGDILLFRKDSTTVGSIRSISGDSIGIGNGDAGLRFISSTNRIQPVDMDNGLNSDALTSLGDTNKRFKDLYLSGGAYLGGTGSANKLDDYEEGTFSGTINGTTYSGEYVKVGKLVTVSCSYNTASATGNIIAVVPFNATGAVSSANQGQTINRSTSSTHPAGTYAAIFSTTNNVYAYNYSGSTLSTPASGTGNFQFSYYTNS